MESLDKKNNKISQLIETLEKKELFQQIDIAIGERLSQERNSLFFLICYLSLAHRLGHNFIQRDSKGILPNPKTLFFEEPQNEDPIDLTYVNALLDDGFSKCISNPLAKGIILEKNRLYFERFWNYEKEIISQYIRLQNEKSHFEVDTDSFSSLVQQALENKEITYEQKEIILSLSKQKISFLSGGPGTGKTYTVGKFLKWLILSKKDEYFNVLLSGPTGKATSNLENSMKSAFGSTPLPPNVNCETKTLHALLKMRRFTAPSNIQSLGYDCIIIDESSMIDIQLMGLLLSSIHKSKIIFLGDPWQLPPIEGGAPFKDFITLEKKFNPLELTTCLRTEIQDIQLLSSLVRDGYEDEVILLLEKNQENNSNHGISFKKFEPQTSTLDDALSYCAKEFEKQFKYSESPLELLQKQKQFRLLSPLKDGPLGISSFNKNIKSYLNDKSLLTPIIITQNDYQLNLMNGEIGFSYENIAYFPEKISNSIRKIPLSLISHYDLAYALSVHKSQGSEFDHVIIFLPPGSLRFGRKMLYTAITRARKKIEIWGDIPTICSIIRNDETRLSFIADGILEHKSLNT